MDFGTLLLFCCLSGHTTDQALPISVQASDAEAQTGIGATFKDFSEAIVLIYLVSCVVI